MTGTVHRPLELADHQPPLRLHDRHEAAPLEEVAVWAETYRRVWDASYDRLEGVLATLEAA